MRIKVIFSILIGLSVMISCNKDSCYDEQLFQANKNGVCPTNCPGVIGCDGKTYCNECEAARHGIRIKE